ncbi:MAG: electron transfer flavoprotein subunit beta/FixA family protein [Methanobacteriota archaeon]
MDYIVLTKGVPDFREGKVKFKEDNTLDRGGTPTVMNPNDRFALEAALEAKVKHGGTVRVVCMGPPNYKSILREAMSVYADELYLLSDVKFAGADTLATAEALSAAIRKIRKADVIYAGFKTADGETGQTGPQTAWKLKYPIVTHVIHQELDADRKILRARRVAYDEIEEIEAPLPCFVVTDPGFTSTYRRARDRLVGLDLRRESAARAEKYEEALKVWTAADIPTEIKKLGLPGSPTVVKKVEPIPAPPSERTATVLDGRSSQDVDRLAEILLSAGGA